MEALNVALKSVATEGFFHGVNLPNNGPVLSHVLYADDALLMGSWSTSNALNLVRRSLVLSSCFGA